SRVDLDPTMRDRFGMPLARIASVLEAGDIARLRFMAKKSYDLLAASGADRIYETYSSWDWFSATHVFGTCRMGNDPGNSLWTPSAAATAGAISGLPTPVSFRPPAEARRRRLPSRRLRCARRSESGNAEPFRQQRITPVFSRI